MMLDAALGLAWIATCYRLWVSASQPRTIWRTCFTVAMVSTATAFTLYRMRAPLDRAVGIWNVSGLAAHLVMVVGIGFLLIYLNSLRIPRVTNRSITIYLCGAGVTCVILVGSWLLAPLHNRPTEDLLTLSADGWVVIYCIAFWAFVAWALIGMARTCLARGRTFRRDDPARSVSLLLIGAASVAGIPVVVSWSGSILIEHITGLETSRLNAVGDAILPWAVLLDAVGVLSLLAVGYLGALAKVWSQWRRLRPLWQSMITRFPEIHLPLHRSGGLLIRLQTRVERAIIEIHDALRVAKVEVAEPSTGVLPIDTLAAALLSSGTGARSAADLLARTETREADVQQLIALANAYQSVRR